MRILQQSFRKHVLLAVIVAICVLIVTLLLGRYFYRFTYVAEGARDGYAITGYYPRDQDSDQPLDVMSFGHPKRGKGDFQHLTSDETVSGRFEKTDDPNIYTLTGSHGESLGYVHLAIEYPDNTGIMYYTDQHGATVRYKKKDSTYVIWSGDDS